MRRAAGSSSTSANHIDIVVDDHQQLIGELEE